MPNTHTDTQRERDTAKYKNERRNTETMKRGSQIMPRQRKKKSLIKLFHPSMLIITFQLIHIR